MSLPPDMRVVLYQGNLISDRGIEQSMDAILAVPDAVLALLGYGALRDGLEAQAGREPYRGRVYLLRRCRRPSSWSGPPARTSW